MPSHVLSNYYGLTDRLPFTRRNQAMMAIRPVMTLYDNSDSESHLQTSQEDTIFVYSRAIGF